MTDPTAASSRDLLCPDCGHHIHRPKPGKCGWYDCPCPTVTDPTIEIKVYVVEAGVYSDRGIDGVYASPEEAMAANPGGTWEYSEYDFGGRRWLRWVNGLDWDSARSIEEFVVSVPAAALRAALEEADHD